jgi:hypothetical protein
MEEEFYSTIKLSSGEELISKVCFLTEENSLLLDKPLLVEKIKQKRHGKDIEGFVLKEWINSSYDTMFVIKMEQVITMSELDERVQRFYLKSLDEEQNDSPRMSPDKMTKRMGYLGSVKETKKFLEDIYKRS